MKCVTARSCSMPHKGGMSPIPHNVFMKRIRKSMYFGGTCPNSSKMAEDIVTRPLAEYASELFSEPHKGHSLNRLTTVAAGSVHASPCSLIMALIYLDRLNVLDPGYVRRITPQELFIVSMMISTKFYLGHDEEVYISEWAEDGNMTEDRLKQLELEFLYAIDWNIYISNEQFFNKLSNVERILAQREGLRRGWLTYTELAQMLPSFTVVKFLLNNITVMAVSYAAGVMTIAGAFFLASQVPGSALHCKSTTTTATTSTQTQVIPPTTSTIVTDEMALMKNISTQTAATITFAPNAQHNATACDPLNVEAELLKLDHEYHEEAKREESRKRNSEIQPADVHCRVELSKKLSFGSVTSSSHGREDGIHSHDIKRNWLTFKGEYSDNQRNQRTHFSLTSDAEASLIEPTVATADIVSGHLANCDYNLNNYTNFMFWSLFADAADNSFVRFQWMWFKLM